jgi:outer membrane immunogenic protein
MRRTVLASLGLVSALILAGPVAAQQTASRSQQAQRMPPRPVNWSGFQYGGFGGVSSMPMNFVEPGAVLCPVTGLLEPPTCPETPFSFSGRRISATFGAFVGYNAQFGNTVGGIEADVAWKHGSISQALSIVSPVAPGTSLYVPPVTRAETFTGSMTQRADGSLRLRYGVLVTPWTLAYATGGGALGSVCGSFSYAATLTGAAGLGGAPPATAFGADNWCQTRAGYTVGGGVETSVAMFANAKARFEYRYTDFGSFSRDVPLAVLPGAPCGGAFLCTGNAHIDMRAAFHTFRVGLGFGI